MKLACNCSAPIASRNVRIAHASWCQRHGEQPFTPERERHRNPMFTQDTWRRTHCRIRMRDWGNPGRDWQDADGYCLDRYSSIEYHGAPGGSQ